ncbi:MAG: cysteine desulfurase, partial [Thermoplasmata archaeon]|nr:cysteine desulfurase [Thermoplasmata archaeon]
MTLEIPGVRAQFPALRVRDDGFVPAYLDSACMSLVPQATLAAMEEYYRDYPGCAGRSLHRFAEEVSHRFEAARETFAGFLGAESPSGIVFVRNSTEAINVVGQGLPWKRGDRVLVSDQEHNSNLILWQRLGPERGVRLEILPLPDDGTFDGDALDDALARGVRLVSLFHTSNLDGRSLPVREVVERAHAKGALVLIDGCQAAPHRAVDLARDGVDFYAISAHKMLGPTGTGVLAGRPDALAGLRPLVAGGETVEWSTLTEHQLRPPPYRFEAGLQNYAGVLGAAAGVAFLRRTGLADVEAHDRALNARVTRALADEPRLHRLGPEDPAARPSIFAFSLDGIDPHDAALFLDEGHGVMVRSGRHCVHSWYAERGLDGNVRASFYLYSDGSDADRLVAGVRELLARMPGSPSGTSASTRTAAGPSAPS